MIKIVWLNCKCEQKCKRKISQQDFQQSDLTRLDLSGESEFLGLCTRLRRIQAGHSKNEFIDSTY